MMCRFMGIFRLVGFLIVNVGIADFVEWVSGDNNAVAEWEYGETDNGVVYHKVHRQTQLLFTEVGEKAEWGNWYWATHGGAQMTYQSGPDVDVRGQFMSKGRLANSKDRNFRPISKDWPVFGFAINFDLVNSSPASALFTIGLYQTQAIQYDGPSGVGPVPSLWTSYFQDERDAVDFFYHDYPTANSLSWELDLNIDQDSKAAAGDDYLTLTSLAVRQAFGANQLCGTIEEPYIFTKEISSSGNVNTVDVIFPTHPIFLYTNPTLLKLLLRPIFEIQESGKYPNNYAMHDIGSRYPNATGYPQGTDEKMPLEECGNMVIMALAYAQKTKDTEYLKTHYNKLMQWTEYLVDDALYPANQISTDDFAGSLAYVYSPSLDYIG